MFPFFFQLDKAVKLFSELCASEQELGLKLFTEALQKLQLILNKGDSGEYKETGLLILVDLIPKGGMARTCPAYFSNINYKHE